MDTTHRPQAPQSGGNVALKYIAGAVLLAILFVVGLLPKLRNNSELAAAATSASTSAPEVTLVSAREAKPDNLLIPGDVQAIESTAVQARTSGYISRLYVDIGSRVKVGQVLADIVSPDVDQQVAQANADTAKSRATVGQSLAGVMSLQASVAQSQADASRQRAAIVQSQAALNGAKSTLAQAKAGVAEAQARLAQSRQGVKVQIANLAQSQAQFDLAAANSKRYETLLAQGFVSQEDYDQAAATYKTSAASLDAVRANIQAARSDVTASEQTVKSNQSLVEAAKSGVDAAAANVQASQSTYTSSLATVQAAKSNVSAGRAAVQANQAAVGSSVANERRYDVLRGFQQVVAPFTGVITSRNVDVGSLVSPGNISAASNTATPNVGLFGIARTDTLRVYVNLPQTYYSVIKAGSKATVFIREVPGHPFIGTVYQASGALDPSTRTLLTEVRLPNSNGELLPGMYAQVQFTVGNMTTLRVPSAVLMIDASGTRVAVADSSNHVHFKKVVLGRDYGTEVEVLSGLDPADRLVGNPSDQLTDGGLVSVVAGGGK